jgi:hypothetical protein
VPRPRDAEAYWREVDHERAAMSASAGIWQRIRAALSLRTFKRS